MLEVQITIQTLKYQANKKKPVKTFFSVLKMNWLIFFLQFFYLIDTYQVYLHLQFNFFQCLDLS